MYLDSRSFYSQAAFHSVKQSTNFNFETVLSIFVSPECTFIKIDDFLLFSRFLMSTKARLNIRLTDCCYKLIKEKVLRCKTSEAFAIRSKR